MSNKGLVRRIDDLGRIVIPSEYRDVLNINNQDMLEISIDNNRLIIEKYSKIDNYLILLKIICELFNNVIITNKDIIIASSYSNLFNRNISSYVKKEEYCINNFLEMDGKFYIMPLINNTDLIGLLIMVNNNNNIKLLRDVIIKYINS